MKQFVHILFVLLVVAGSISGQRFVNVQPEINDALYVTIQADSAARMAALPTQTIYVLARNGNYPLVTALRNNDFFLHIKAADGPGYKPLIYPSANAAGGYAARNFEFYSDGKIENVIIDQARPSGGYNNRAINLYTKVSVTFKGCEIAHDRGAAFVIQGDSSSLFVEDCFVHSIGYEKGAAGNGRFLDVRNANYTDSVSVVNSTIFYISDRVVRNVAPHIKYVKFDHCTFFDNINVAGFFMVGKTHELILTNNLIKNPISYGTRLREQHQMEQTNPIPERGQMWVMIIDTVYADSKFRIKNNNLYWEQAVQNIWAKYDSVETVGTITPTLKKALGADSVNAYYAEPITFTKQTPVDFITFLDSALSTWGVANRVLPQNWFFGYIEDVDYSYGTTALSYTAADNGLPVGDLNWYPAKKAIWQTTSVERTDVMPTEFALEQNYPNPFNPATKIVYNVPQASKVRLEVFDILGRLVTTLIDQEQQAGQYRVDFEGSKLSSGVYVYRLSTPGLVQSKKMMLIK